MKNIRTFFAADLTGEVIQQLALIQKDLKSKIYPVKWVNPDNFHITIKFLGDTTPEKVVETIKKSKQAFENSSPFKLSFRGLGAFPNFINPKVIWIGVESDNLINIYNKLEYVLLKIGFPEERRKFNPHMSLGRIKSRLKTNLYNELQNYNDIEINTYIKSISFIKSTLTPKGPVYSPLKTFKLK